MINSTRCCAGAPPSTVPTPAAPETGFVQERLPPPSYQQGGGYGDDEDDDGDDDLQVSYQQGISDNGDADADGHCSCHLQINMVAVIIFI